MINPLDLVQVKAFARQDGFFLAIVWLAAMWQSLHSPESIWGPLMFLSTPFFIGWRLQSFRNYALDGRISFRRGLAFSCYVFFYASVLFALGQYAYFRFLDGGLFLKIINESLDVMKPYYLQQGISADNLEIGRKMIGMMSPLNLAFTFMMYNLFMGALVSPVIALFCKKTKKQ